MEALARNTDPRTSHIAAHHQARKLSLRRQQVLGLVAEHPGKTAGELGVLMYQFHKELGIRVASQTPQKRLPELEERNLVKRLPARQCTDSGEQAATWVVAI